VALIASAASLALVAGCSGGEADDGTTELTLLMNDEKQDIEQAEALVDAFESEHSDISIEIDTRPGGTEGDNLIKTRLSTGEMADIFKYNSGSLMQALNPDQTLVDMSDQPWVEDITDGYISAVQTDNGIYGYPWGTTYAGGLVYNTAIYEELGLEVPKSWDQFMANNEIIAQAGYDPVIQSYGTTWTSQLFVLGDFANVQAADPQWAEEYTAGNRSYAEPPALAGFKHLEAVAEAGYFNKDFPTATYEDAAEMLAKGTGVHYPVLTFVLDEINLNYPDAVEDIGFMAIPANDPSLTSATIWQPDGVYIPKTTEGAKREAAIEFIKFMNSQQACEVFNENSPPKGPYPNTCELPDDVPPLLKDIQSYLDAGNSAPALEFLSPVKGPNLENIMIGVGSGIQSAEEGAQAYDDDVVAQARQLGLEGW